MKATNFIGLLLTLCFATYACYSQEDKSKKRKETEENTSPFSITHFSKDTNSYYVLSVQVVGGKIVLDEKATIKEVGGKLPYPSGNFRVLVLNSNNEALADYHMQDPLIVRSCDKGENHLMPIDTGSIYIPMPKSSDIAKIQFSRGRETIQEIEVAGLLKRTIENKDQKNEDEEPE